jgi:ABC-type transport system involved in multi-copper enzyme maturation permease subunit
MRAIWVLAKNTYKEVIRDRILYALILFAILLMGLSLALGQLSFAEQARISADFGLSAIHLCAVILAIFIGSNLVYKEIEKKTILTILVRPISRIQFILGKSLGLTLVILTMMAGLALILCLVFWGLKVPVGARFLLVLVGLLAEALVLLGFTLLFSMISKPLLVVCFSVGVFLIGHWHQSLAYFANKAEGGPIKAISWFVDYFLPDLERVNWKDLIVYSDQPLQLQAKMISLSYALLWFGLCISVTAVLFKRRDVG